MPELKLDLDRTEIMQKLFPHITNLEVDRIINVIEFFHLKTKGFDIRHTKSGLHVRITIYKDGISGHNFGLIPFLQLAMGSHYQREMHNYYRAYSMYKRKNIEIYNLLFKHKRRLYDGYISIESDKCSQCCNFIKERLQSLIKSYKTIELEVSK